MTAPASYTQEQIMLCLAYLAYTDMALPPSPSLNEQIKQDLIANLSNTANVTLPPVQGQWQVVWGPSIHLLPHAKTQDNMMYVAQLMDANSPAQYAVAIRGTNPGALLDWLEEDLNVKHTAAWNGVGGALISKSTRLGLDIVTQNLTDPQTGQTLLSFLQSTMSAQGAPAASICCTGHSLGSTLAQVLALYLRDQQTSWDPSGLATVTTINFAGPSAGNAAFAAYFDQQFAYTQSALPFWVSPSFTGSSALSYANCVRSSLDIVPRAWATGTLKTIANLYEWPLPPIHAPSLFADAIKREIEATQAIGYTQTQHKQTMLTGTRQSESGISAYGDEVEYQHHMSYPILLEVPALLTWTAG